MNSSITSKNFNVVTNNDINTNSMNMPSAFSSVNLSNVKHPSAIKINLESQPSTSNNPDMLPPINHNKQSNNLQAVELHISCENDDLPKKNYTCKTPPLICEQGPSAPSSPTVNRHKRNNLYVDGLQRLDLLSPNFVPNMDYSKLTPLSPSYPTSDLGSSPRSSISITQSALPNHFTSFRDFKKSSLDYDGDSDVCSKDLLSPRGLLSPAPFSPFSEDTEMPFFYRSPNLSPVPTRYNHFSFDQIRSRSSMSNRADQACQELLNLNSFDMESRERSRSEGEMNHSEKMDCLINRSTISVPTNRVCSPNPLHLYRDNFFKPSSVENEITKHFEKSVDSLGTIDSSKNNYNYSADHDDSELMDASVSTQVSRQPTIEEPPPEPTLLELFNTNDLSLQRQKQVEEWLKQQAEALEVLRNSLIPQQQDSKNLLKVPSIAGINPAMIAPTPQVDINAFAKFLVENSTKQSQSLFKRSHSETDVSGTKSKILNDQPFVCEHCGQSFAMHDRLAKHIASRHRDRSASVNDDTTKTHKCSVCSKSFGRSDMLTRHMRLHTGVKPYSCVICGQVFSRSDHLSTHQRTHTGEKPYRCPQCSYSASRRDMITRHMRTHTKIDILSPNEQQLQLHIGKLSLNQKSPFTSSEKYSNDKQNVFVDQSISSDQSLKNINLSFTPNKGLSSSTSNYLISQNSADQLHFSSRFNNQISGSYICRSTPNLNNIFDSMPEQISRPLSPSLLIRSSSSIGSSGIVPNLNLFAVNNFQVNNNDNVIGSNANILQQLASTLISQQHPPISETNNISQNTSNTTSNVKNSENAAVLMRQSSIGGFGFN